MDEMVWYRGDLQLTPHFVYLESGPFILELFPSVASSELKPIFLLSAAAHDMLIVAIVVCHLRSTRRKINAVFHWTTGFGNL